MKKIIFLILMLLCVSGLAQAFRVIGNYEGSLDGWILQQGATSVYSTTTGVTYGARALELTVAGGWKESMKVSIFAHVERMKVAETITVDYTSRNDSGQIPDWWMQGILRLNGDACGYVDLDKGWDGVDWSPTTRHVTWTIPQSVRDSFNNNPGTWCEVILYTNCGDAGGKFWLDNFRINWPITSAYDPIPVDQSRPDPATTSTLCWSNIDGTVQNEVYFGTTEPNYADPNQTWRNTLTLIGTISGPAQQQCINIPAEYLPLASDVKYYWLVDGYKGTIIPGEPNIVGDVWQFTPLSNAAPVFNLGPDQYHWLGQYGTPGQVSVTLDPTVTDDGKPTPPGALTYEWTKLSSTRVDDLVFPITTKSLTLPFTLPGKYELELAVSDSDMIAKDTVIIYVGTNPCDTYRRTPGAAWFNAGDFDQNCKVEMSDLTTLVSNWLDCSDFITHCQ